MSPEPVPIVSRALRRDAAQNRRRLLDAAEQVFAERGLDASVEEVARVAGVGVGTLYRRFVTKDALIAELVGELLGEVIVLAREALAVPDGKGLEEFLYAIGPVLSSGRGCLARLWNDPETIVIKNECRFAVGELLLAGKAHGRVRPDADLTDVDLLFLSLRGVIDATQGLDASGYRRHIAIMVAGLRYSSEALPVPPLSNEQAEWIRDSTRGPGDRKAAT